jgi:serine/threonine-protein kinase
VINQVVNQRYEVLEKIGDSPLFQVYKARDRVLNRVVAFKTVQPPYANDPNFVEALRAGMMAASNLNHPHITRVLEFGEEEGTPYFVTEFVRGINLKERIRRIAPFTLSVAIDFACAIGEALHYAHSLGQVHGDLRPQNVVISPEGAVKLTDFGVQRAMARSPQAQRENLARAASYHAPELSTTLPGSMSGDIYALGAILYEMLTGAPLYVADTPEAVAEQHAFSAIPSPRTLNPGVPRSVEGIIIKCLQKRPDQRYRNTADLLNDLKSVRDALRFGKSLSWSPIEEQAAAAPVAPARAVPPAAPAARIPEPVADVAASSIPATMPANNRLRAADERVSIYIKIAIGTVTVLIICVLVGFAAIWAYFWGVPKSVSVPQLVGQPIDSVRTMAQKMGVHLIEHPEYTDKPRNLVFKTDHDNGAQIHSGQLINIWYSQGPAYVNVPNLTNLSQDDAEKALKDAGLVVGKITPEYSSKVQAGYVVRQTVSYKKRVFHDTAVDMVVSDGPKPDYASGDNNNSPNPFDTGGDNNGSGDNNNAAGNNTGDANSPDNYNANPDGTPNLDNNNGNNSPVRPDEQMHSFDRTISIPEDGQGIRQVRIEYRDAQGWHAPVVNEPHDAGERLPVNFDYFGKTITLRIYYDDKVVKEVTFDPQDKRAVR